ncbi:S8 family peptidase [Luteimonas sp. A478]
MKKYRLSLAVAAAMVVGATSLGASASEQIFEAKMHDPVAAPAAGTPGNRFVVKFNAPAGRTVDDRIKSMTLESAVGRAGLGASLRGTNATGAAAALSAKIEGRMGAPGWHVVSTSRRLSAMESARFLGELQADPTIAVAEPDRLYQHMGNMAPAAAPNDPQYSYQWNFRDGPGGVRAEAGWEISTGEGVVVAIIDTGIVQNHLDLQANVIPGYDMISWAEISRRDADERVPGGWDLGDWVEANYCTQLGTNPHPADTSSWHGSHVAGTVAQETNNGSGMAGLAHGAQVMPLRALGSCGGLGSDIADAMLWAAGIEVPGLPINENPAEVINMSLGSVAPTACSALYQDAINQVNATGTIIVVAAGNDNANAGDYTMSSCDGVISVGATNVAGNKSGYSSWGPAVDISAPGGDFSITADGNDRAIWQVTNGGDQGPLYDVDGAWILRGFQGTSMASPHVAAAVAMVQSVVDMPLDREQMRSLLMQTARAFTTAPSNPMGAGILNLEALLAKAIEEPCDPEVEECEEPGIVATPITNKVPVRGLSGTVGGETLYAIEVPAGVKGPLSITTSGGSGNVSLYVSLDAEPGAEAADWSSTRPGNNETVRINNPAAGTYYVKLAGAYSNVTLQARHN